MVHTSPYLFFLLGNCTYNGHIIKNEIFGAYFMRTLNSCVIYKFHTVNPGCLPSQPHTSDRVQFGETFGQQCTCIFAVVNCADVALSVFHYPVLTRNRIFLQL